MFTLIAIALLAAPPTDCGAYAANVVAVCDEVLHTDLDVNCGEQILRVEVAREQANGDLFNAGDSNAEAAQAVCRSFAASLAKDVAKARAQTPKPIAWGTECGKLQASVKTKCLATIGKQEMADNCRQLIDTLQRARRDLSTSELQCGLVGRMLGL
jgi:hypothetical protein